MGYALSARCVLDTVTETIKEVEKEVEVEKPTTPAEAPSEEFCAQFDAMYVPAKWSGSVDMCVTKYNVGDVSEDGSGPPIAAGITVVGVNSSCTSCCWKGRTAATCNNTGNGSGENASRYDGCNRTVCNWIPAYTSCMSWAPKGMQPGYWRLPTHSEISVWATYISQLSINQGKNGLQMCDRGGAGYGSTQCIESQYCIGAYGNCCYTSHIWSDVFNQGDRGFLYLTNGSVNVSYNTAEYAFGARCVYDGNKNISSIETNADKQKICDKYNALYVPAKYNGTSEDLCVTKFNAGDDSGPNFSNYSAIGVTLLGTNQSCSKTGYCCWQGRTADACTDVGNGNSTYSGCNRTVCGWAAAKAICSNWNPDGTTTGKWRLPTNSELSKWATEIKALSIGQGINGLQMCDRGGAGYGSTQCIESQYCIGAYGNCCYTSHIWSDVFNSNQRGFLYLTNGSVNVSYNTAEYAFGVRCVSSEVLK